MLPLLGNYKYNIKITGYLKLDKDVAPTVDKKCVYVAGIGDGACCCFLLWNE